MMRRWLVLLLAFTFCLGAGNALAQEVTLYRDRYGVPSLVAKRLPDAIYGLGYAMAQDNAERMALNFKQARGRLAEVEGPGQLIQDAFLQSLGIESLAKRKAESLSGEMKMRLERFLAGANRALAEQKGRLPDWIEPFTAVDVLALAQMLNAAFPLYDISAQLTGGMGSNQFAVGAKRSATGHAILSADPHLLWSGPLLWYEFAVYAPGWQFRGITLSGMPFGLMGHTDKVAWCMTNNDPDLFDFFTVQTNPDNPKQYNYHGSWRDFEYEKITLFYRENGQKKSRTQTVVRTAWGPMLPFRSQAVRLSMLGAWEMQDQIIAMAQARNAKEFRDALKQRGLSMWNIVYADTQGNIGYQYNGRVPRRDPSLDWTKPVNGADPRTQWGDLLSLDEMPHVENPASNLLVNGNSAPWLTPLGPEIKSAGWPAYVTTYGPTTRYERLAELLSADKRISLDAAKRYATDTEVPYARRIVPELLRVGRDTMDVDVKAALQTLAQWNFRADVDSRGCGLYLYWLRAARIPSSALARKNPQESWSAAESAKALEALREAARAFRERFGSLDAPWGAVHVMQRGAQTVGVSGFNFGDMAAVAPNSGNFQQGQVRCFVGSSFRMIVNLNRKGVQSWSILPYGNSHNPQNPHYADQMPLFRLGQYKETHFGAANARRHAASTLKLRVEATP